MNRKSIALLSAMSISALLITACGNSSSRNAEGTNPQASAAGSHGSGTPSPAIGESFQRGIVLQIDGEDYFMDGPLEDARRDLPGHSWVKLGPGLVWGRHVNTGPFGLPKWWSSDAEDGQHLFDVLGIVDEWTPEKAESYRALGFSHYHELVTVEGRTPHPSKVMWFQHIAQGSFTVDGGFKPWMRNEVTAGLVPDFMPNAHVPYPHRETYLYIGCVDVGGKDPDFMLVVGADPNDPKTYGKIVHREDMPKLGDELHHYGFNVTQTRMIVPGLFSGRIHVLDIATDPARPTLIDYHEDLTPNSGYTTPHTVIGMPDGGYVLSMIGSNTDTTAPGGLVKLDANARVEGHFGPGPNRDSSEAPPKFMYDLGINPLRNRMITTAFGLPANIGGGINVAGLGDELYVWDFKKREVLQVENLGPGTGPLEVRWLEEPGAPVGFTNAPGTSQIWRWKDLDLDGTYEFEVAIQLPEGSVPTDILLSHDDSISTCPTGWAAT